MPRAERTGAVLLASGLSSRFDGTHKLAAPLHGRPLGLWALDALGAAGLDRVQVVVSAHTPDAFVEAAHNFGFEIVLNPQPEAGMGNAIALAFAQPGLGARAFIALADMPFIAPGDYAALHDALNAHADRSIAVPVHEGMRGHPVLFAARHFAALALLDGDRGAGVLLRDNPAEVLEIASDNPGVLIDIDTPEALAHAERRFPA